MEGALMAKKKTRKKPTSRPRPTKRTSAKVKKPAKKPAKKPKPAPETSVAAQLPEPTPDEIKTAQRHFALSLVARGQAVPKGTPLPPGATHEIIGYDSDGTPLVQRKRFSLRG
jgi:hypothetical protein